MKIKTPLNLTTDDMQAFTERELELCYIVFFQSEAGNELLKMWEDYYYHSDIYIPGQPDSRMAHGEGMLHFLRNIRRKATHYAKGK